MAKVLLKGNEFNTCGEISDNTSFDFKLTAGDLSEVSLAEYKGKKILLNIFPSLDTPVCATSVRTFNKNASELDNVIVVNISKDLPFAQARFCGAEGIENAITLSAHNSDFGVKTGVEFADGPLRGLLSRAVVILNEEFKPVYWEQVKETTEEPNYGAALEALK